MEAFIKLPVSITDMIAHGHGDIQYAHYSLDLYPANSNHIVDSIAKVLWDLEDVSKCVTRQIFPDSHTSPLFDALLEGGVVYNSLLLPSQSDSIVPRSSLLSCIFNRIMHAQIIRIDTHFVFSPWWWQMLCSGRCMWTSCWSDTHMRTLMPCMASRIWDYRSMTTP